jgi:hypothetical protein
MPHGTPLVSFEHETGYRKFAHMIGSILVSDVQSFGNIFHRQFRLALQQIHDLDSPMICESFHYPFKLSVLAAIARHTPILPYCSLLQKTAIEKYTA